MQTLLTALLKELSNGTDVAFNKLCVYGSNGNKTVLTLVTKIDEPVKDLVFENNILTTNTTGLTEQQLLKII